MLVYLVHSGSPWSLQQSAHITYAVVATAFVDSLLLRRLLALALHL